MADDEYSEAVLAQKCLVDKKTGKVIDASNNKIGLSKLPKAPEGREIDQVEIIIHTRPIMPSDTDNES